MKKANNSTAQVVSYLRQLHILIGIRSALQVLLILSHNVFERRTHGSRFNKINNVMALLWTF